ncbi:MAG: electron transfer flavoprotein subunit alpha/FixB family protein [Deltaproteobacteria bacterium]|nr:electron transfer flavoprotein subunit alpha/FixB family protein [Deltaproteobacteria bacterium]
MGDIIVIAEHEKGRLKRYSLELVGKAAELAPQLQGRVHAVLVGEGLQALAEDLGRYGAQVVTILETPAMAAQYNSDGFTTLLTKFIEATKPSVVLAAASPMGKDCLPRVAMRLKTGLIADAVQITVADGKVVARHPIFAGKALVDCIVKSEPQMVLVRPNVFPVPEPNKNGKAEVRAQAADPGQMRAVVKETIEEERGDDDLTEAQIVVSGGRALASSENFKYIRELANAIGGTVGASRAAVDAGYISHDHQVGQTGKTVNPTLYIACGISGAIQHLAGMRTSKYIVAINKDQDAPIFTKADFGVVGDLFAILPLLSERIARIKREG